MNYKKPYSSPTNKLSKNMIVLRDYIDITTGYEFRIFIHNNKITAISANDDKIIELDDELFFTKKCIVERCQTLVDRCLADNILPFVDCLMDVFLSTINGVDYDLLIEFNSFGAWSFGGSGLFDWIEDYAQLHGLLPGIECRINDSFQF